MTKIEELTKLDRKVRIPAYIFGYVFGVIGLIALSVGLSLLSGVFALTAVSSAIGIALVSIGLIMIVSDYFIYNCILDKRKDMYADKIVQIVEELLNE
ncbi:MAG: hypothetical protein IJX16_06140 [Clostridia bacterium]|nr:hypothetical protein [Clostridia bacterium]